MRYTFSYFLNWIICEFLLVSVCLCARARVLEVPIAPSAIEYAYFLVNIDRWLSKYLVHFPLIKITTVSFWQLSVCLLLSF
jgi:hypothetical protein